MIRDRLPRLAFVATVVTVVLLVTAATPVAAATETVNWQTANDWDGAVSESGVVHESVTDTDHTNASTVRHAPNYGSSASAELIHLPLDEDSGSTAHDVSGNGNDFSINAPSVGATGIANSTSVDFDGDDSLDFSGSLTASQPWAEAWVNPDVADKQAILIFGTSDTDRAIDIYYDINGNDKLCALFQGNTDQICTSTTVPTGAWTHVSAGYNGSNYLIYRNGTLENTLSVGSKSFSDPDTAVVGEWIGGGADFFDGRIDGLRYRDGAPTAATVAAHYRAGRGTAHLKTATKTFGAATTPDLSAAVEEPAASNLTATVIGSPSGTAESQTVDLSSGSADYQINWASSHDEFRVNVTMDSSSAATGGAIKTLQLAGETDANEISGTISDTDGSPIDGATVVAVNSSTGTTNASATTNATGRYLLSVSDGQLEIRSEATGRDRNETAVIVSGSDIDGVDLRLGTSPPALDAGAASPTTSVADRQTTLSIPVSDPNIGGLAGDQLAVQWRVEGAAVGSATISTNRTVSQSVSLPEASSAWSVAVIDAAGRATAANFTVDRPPLLGVYNESDETLVGQQVDVSFDSQDSSFGSTANTSTGELKLDGLPSDELVRVSVSADGFVDQSFFRRRSDGDVDVVILPVTDPTKARYEQCFTLSGGGRDFEPAESRLRVVETIAGVDGDVPAVAGAQRFGPRNLACSFLVSQSLYDLQVRNDSEIYRWGPFTAVDDGQTETIEIADVSVGGTAPSGVAFGATTFESGGDRFVRSTFDDPSEGTTNLTVTIANASSGQQIDQTTDGGPLGSSRQVLNLSGVSDAETLNVSFTAARGGESISGSQIVGGVGSLDDRVPLGDTVQSLSAFTLILAVTSFVVIRSPRLAPAIGTGTASVLSLTGLVAIPLPALGLAGAISVLAVYSRGGGQ